MNLNKKIGFLLDTGFTPKFVSSLTESKINLLFEKMAKKETKEETTTSTTYKTFDPKGNPQDAAKLAGLGIHSDPATGKVSLTTTPSGQIQKEICLLLKQQITAYSPFRQHPGLPFR